MADFTSDTQVHGHLLTRGIIFLLLTITNYTVIAQSELSSTSKKALKLYEKGQKEAKIRNFEKAVKYFREAVIVDENFYEAYLRQGSLYHAMSQEDSVYVTLDKYASLASQPSNAVLRRLAFMSWDRGHYEKATAFLMMYLAREPTKVTDLEIALLSESLDFSGKQLMKKTEIKFKELPTEINAFALQYLPAITIDNATMIYTKRDFVNGDEDIVVSYLVDGKWSQAVSVSSKINTALNEGACTISADGNTMIFTSCDKRDSFGSCDLYISRKRAKSWSTPKNLGKPVNTHYWESQPSLSADGSTLYFSSNRPGGQGARDLWVSQWIDNRWSNPQNLGSNINSFKDEITPFIHPNGNTMFFSSSGFVGMGGYDLYKSEKDSVWHSPVNLGFSINTFHDEVALLIAGDGKTSYFARELQKNNQIVDSKIVSFTLPDSVMTRQATFISGIVTNKESKEPLRSEIQVFDVEKNEMIYKALSDSLTGKYTMVLPAGRQLACYVKKKTFLFRDFQFNSVSNTILEPDTIDIELSPVRAGEKIILKNIYFDLNSYGLDRRSESEIRSLVEVMEQNPNINVEISGHTDNRGSSRYNQTLSEKRAYTVYQEIVKQGVDGGRLFSKGYADKYPVMSNETKFGRRSNRRIEFRILGI